MEPEVHEIMIPYSIEPTGSKKQYQGKIYLPRRVIELEPTTKGRCAKRLATRLIPLLLDLIEETWPDVPETTNEARDRQLKTLPPPPPCPSGGNDDGT